MSDPAVAKLMDQIADCLRTEDIFENLLVGFPVSKCISPKDDDESEREVSLLSMVILLCRDDRLADQKELLRHIVNVCQQKSPRCAGVLREARLFDERIAALADEDSEEKVDDTAVDAKRAAKRRQQLILERMRFQQKNFLETMKSSDIVKSQQQSESGSLDGGSGRPSLLEDKSLVRTGYDDSDEEDEDEWGFPTGTLDVELYLSHVTSAFASERTRFDYELEQEQDQDAEEECALCHLPCDESSAFGKVGVMLPTCIAQKAGLEHLTREQAEKDIHLVDSVVWSCGHTVHVDCLTSYLTTLWKSRRPDSEDRLLNEKDKEFCCPVCRRLSNCLLPTTSRPSLLTPNTNSKAKLSRDPPETPRGRLSFAKWLQSYMQIITSCSPPRASPQPLVSNLLASAASHKLYQGRIEQFAKLLLRRILRANLYIPMKSLGKTEDFLEGEIDHVLDRMQEEKLYQVLFRNVEFNVILAEINSRENAGSTSNDVSAAAESTTTCSNLITRMDKNAMESLAMLYDFVVSMDACFPSTEAPFHGIDNENCSCGCRQSSLASAFGSYLKNSTTCPNKQLHNQFQQVKHVFFAHQVLLEQADSGQQPVLSGFVLFRLFLRQMMAISKAILLRSRTGQLEPKPDLLQSPSFVQKRNADLISEALFWCRLVITAGILQALLVLCVEQQTEITLDATVNFMRVETLDDAFEWIQQMVARSRAPLHDKNAPSHDCSDNSSLEGRVSKMILPLVRRICLVLHGCVGINLLKTSCAVCDALHSRSEPAVEDCDSQATHQSHKKELSFLLKLLHLPPIQKFFSSKTFPVVQRELCELWAAQWEARAAGLMFEMRQEKELSDRFQCEANMKPILIPSHHFELTKSFGLIQMPRIYMDFYMKYSDKVNGVCKRCKQIPQHPAVCLLCGTVVCCFSLCCETNGIGECTMHAHECFLGFGYFMLLRACTVILLLGNERRCVWGSLYLDRNGEEDPYLRRGKTLYLSAERYNSLNKLVLSHGFAQNTAVLANTSRREGLRY